MYFQWSFSKQQGFAIGAILMAVVLIAAVAAVISLGMSSGGTTTSRESARIEASSIISQAVEIANIIQNAANYTYLTVELVESSDDCSGGAGACYPALTSGVVLPTVSKNSITTDSEDWQLVSGAISFGAGNLGTTTADRVLLVENLDSSVCLAINQHLYQDKTALSSVAGFPTASGAITGLNTATKKLLNGCVLKANGMYVYYHVVDIN